MNLPFELYCYIALGAIVCALLGCVCSLSALGILQQCGYSGKGYLKWFVRRGNMAPGRYALLSLTTLLLVVLFNLCFSFVGYPYANLISAVAYVGLSVLFYFASKRAVKVPLKGTARLVRLAVCYFILLFLVVFGVCVGLSFAARAIDEELVYLFRYAPLSVLPVFYPFLMIAANFIMKAYETPHNRAIVKKAARALEKSDCLKVGITGSFAKTSVKNFAAELLSSRYRVVATPASYNTPMGIARTVNEKGLDCDIFLAEMGARKTGDIKELCDMVRPDYGVVTGICPQHLETFGSFHSIVKEKGVLAKHAKKGCVTGESAFESGIEGTLVSGRDFSAENVVCTTEGTKFTLRVGNERIEAETKLLGAHAAEDVALAAALCSMLGMSLNEIAEGISRIRPVPHRLEKIEANGLNILDDSYNSNVEGAKDAVKTLRLFGGKKYVVTPGIVELGQIEEKENGALGASLVGLDGVILVGETLVLSVRAGYLEAGGDEQKLRVVPTLKAAQEILSGELSAGDSVLFLNDLPDVYL